MSNPETSVIFAYATDSQARAVWTHMLDNDQFEIAQIVIETAKGPAPMPVAWIIVPKGTAHVTRT